MSGTLGNNVQGNLHIPTLVSTDRQYTSLQSPFIVPSMDKEGAASNLGSPLSTYNAGFGDWFGGEDKEKSPGPEGAEKVEPEKSGGTAGNGLNYGPVILFVCLGLAALVFMRGGKK